MANLVKDYNDIINTLIGIAIIMSSATAWYFFSITGINYFWLVFFAISLAIFAVLVKRFDFYIKHELKSFFKDKYNIILFTYMIWMSISYMANYQGKSTLLYIFKMWFILGVYLYLVIFYLKKVNEQGKCDFMNKICSIIFALGIVHAVIASCEFVFDSNVLLGIKLTRWVPYNPASLYANVNGLGTYMFISIMAGIYCLFLYSKSKFRPLYIAGIVLQIYVLFLTVARTSMITTAVFIVGTLLFLKLDKTKRVKNVLTKKNIMIFIMANIIMLCVVNFNTIDGWLTNGARKGHIRTASDMLEEKNSKLFNQRQFIWKAVIKDRNEYVVFGDGLKYNIVHKIDVGSVIAADDKDAVRISYHNTMFRYFASNGALGLLLFLALFAYNPLKILVIMFREKKLKAKHYFVLLFFLCIFLYMQMEEVYLGEIGGPNLVTLAVMAYANSILTDNKGDEI
mgnify:CR=1 FL=1